MLILIFYLYFRNAESVDSISSCDIICFNPFVYLLQNLFLLMQRKILLLLFLAIIPHSQKQNK